MKEFIKNNLAIVLAFSLPVLIVIVVALSVYIPSLLVSTNYNFIYTSCGENKYYYNYNCNSYLQNRYSVVNNKLVVNEVDMNLYYNQDGTPDKFDNYHPRIFLHNTKKNESREITVEEAQTFGLNTLITSPDGVTVSNDYNGGGDFFFPFGGTSSSYGYYLAKGKAKVKLNLINSSDRYYYQDNFRFIGWIIN